MGKDIFYLDPEDNVNKFISFMEKHHIHEVPIVSKGKLVGLVHYKDVVKRGIVDPSKLKLGTIMTSPPLVSSSDPIEKASELIFSTGYRALPVVENKKLIGIISVLDIIDNISKELKQTTAEEVMTPAIIIRDNEDIGKARVLMRENNISRIPVADSQGRTVGILGILDLLRSIKPKERMNWYSMAAEKLTVMNIPVSVVMNKHPITAEKTTKLSEIAKLMKKYKTSGIVITVDSGIIGVVTTRDLLEFYLSKKKQKGVYIQITGLGDEDEFILSTVDRIIRDSVQKISSVYNPQFLFLHVKKYEKGGKGSKYSIRCRFMTDRGMFISKAFAWDLRDAVGNALDQLERIVLKDKEKLKTKRRR